MEGGSITLIIKAANQSVPDHRLDCNCDWTVSHLKNHLSTVHPSKPRVDEQRLIYSGQLLLDDLKLRSVLRHPTENNSYTIHLVCSPPRNAPVPSPARTQPLPPVSTQRSPLRAGSGGVATPTAAAAMTVPQHEGSASPPPTSASSSSDTSVNSESTDGIRRRIVNVNSEDVSGSTPQGIEAAAGYPSQAQVSMGVLQASTDPIQQMATMQQMYANYMAYMQYMQMGGGLAGGGGVTWPQQMLHHVPPAPNPASSTPSAASAAAAAADQSEPQQQQQQLPDQNIPLNQQQQPQQPQPAPQIRMNAQGGEVEDDDENEGMGRDWLDWIYVLSRMVVLLSVVYFYSTISRFMVVVCIAMMLYLYQAGWFRPTRRPAEQPPREANENELNDAQDDRNNNVNNNNNNNEVPGEALIVENQEQQQQQQQQPPPPPQQQPLPNDDGDVGVGTDRAVENEELHVRPSILALSWTFLTTFFTSLIPEQPQVI